MANTLTLEKLDRKLAAKQAKAEASARDAWRELVAAADAGQLDEQRTLDVLESLGKTTADLAQAVKLRNKRRALAAQIAKAPAAVTRIEEIDQEIEALKEEADAARLRLQEANERLATERCTCEATAYSAREKAERELLDSADPVLAAHKASLEKQLLDLHQQIRWAEIPFGASRGVGMDRTGRRYAAQHNLHALRELLRIVEQRIRGTFRGRRRVKDDEIQTALEQGTRELRARISSAEGAVAELRSQADALRAELGDLKVQMLEP